jgi:hypothetical protein
MRKALLLTVVLAIALPAAAQSTVGDFSYTSNGVVDVDGESVTLSANGGTFTLGGEGIAVSNVAVATLHFPPGFNGTYQSVINSQSEMDISFDGTSVFSGYFNTKTMELTGSMFILTGTIEPAGGAMTLFGGLDNSLTDYLAATPLAWELYETALVTIEIPTTATQFSVFIGTAALRTAIGMPMQASMSITGSPVPEPATMLVLLAGAGLVARRRRSR